MCAFMRKGFKVWAWSLYYRVYYWLWARKRNAGFRTYDADSIDVYFNGQKLDIDWGKGVDYDK